MSKILVMCCVVVVCVGLVVCASAGETKESAEVSVPAAAVATAKAEPVETTTRSEREWPNPAYGFGRGLVNIPLCWLEIPRCMIYDNAQIPVIGLIVGVPEGAIYTVVRALLGVVDIASLGFSGPSLYGESFPEFIWQSRWLPPYRK